MNADVEGKITVISYSIILADFQASIQIKLDEEIFVTQLEI